MRMVITLAVLGGSLPHLPRGAVPAFEVASVRANTDSVLIYSGATTQPGGGLSAKATTLKDLVMYADAVELREVKTTARSSSRRLACR